jgi:hypothetical protein
LQVKTAGISIVKNTEKTPLRLAGKEGTSVTLDWDAQCIDIDLQMDIATFRVSPGEIDE